MRRELLKQIRTAIEDAEKISLSEPTEGKRKAIHWCVGGLLGISLAICIAMIVRIWTAETIDWHLFVPLSTSMAVFFFTMLYYIKWNDRWFREHADAEFAAKRYKADILRASWVTELVHEWAKEGKGDLPPDLLAAYTKNLFRETGASRITEHPMDNVLAIVKRATDFEIGKGMLSVKGYKPDARSRSDS